MDHKRYIDVNEAPDIERDNKEMGEKDVNWTSCCPMCRGHQTTLEHSFTAEYITKIYDNFYSYA